MPAPYRRFPRLSRLRFLKAHERLSYSQACPAPSSWPAPQRSLPPGYSPPAPARSPFRARVWRVAAAHNTASKTSGRYLHSRRFCVNERAFGNAKQRWITMHRLNRMLRGHRDPRAQVEAGGRRVVAENASRSSANDDQRQRPPARPALESERCSSSTLVAQVVPTRCAPHHDAKSKSGI